MSQQAIRILCVDDEASIRRALRPPLLDLGFQLVEASRGEEALQQLRSGSFDIVLLDINMPGIGGLETLRRIRAFAPRLPIVMVTVRDGEEEKVEALELGADDYVTKPFSMRELIARIRTAVRRFHAPLRSEDTPIQIGDLCLAPSRRTVTKNGQPVRLTRKEYEILYYLMGHAGRPVTYAKLLSAVWGADYREEVEYLRTFVRQLRKKIADNPTQPRYLFTDPHVGYRFVDPQMLAEDKLALPDDAQDPSSELSCAP